MPGQQHRANGSNVPHADLLVRNRNGTRAAGETRGLRPFFGYYGGKWRNALNHYPRPEFTTIIEPFAGSAGYSLRYANLNVVLCEIDPILTEVWRYLIRVKPKEILSISDVEPGGSVDDLKICQEAQWLVGFWLNRATASPRRSPSKWMRERIRPGSFWGDRVRQTIASQVTMIRHWKIHNCDYVDCPTSAAATWFVDPPYQWAGQHYRFGSDAIDYPALAAWCRSRKGQVIVCENEGATWLPFRTLADVKTTRAARRSSEVCWLRSTSPTRMTNGESVTFLLARARAAVGRLNTMAKRSDGRFRAEQRALFW